MRPFDRCSDWWQKVPAFEVFGVHLDHEIAYFIRIFVDSLIDNHGSEAYLLGEIQVLTSSTFVFWSTRGSKVKAQMTSFGVWFIAQS